MAISRAPKPLTFAQLWVYAQKPTPRPTQNPNKRKADDPEPSTMTLSEHPQLALRSSKKVCKKTGDVDNHAPPPQLAAPSGDGTPAYCQDPPLGSADGGNVGPSAQSSHASDEVSLGDPVQLYSAQGTSPTHTILQNSTSSSIILSLGSKTSSTFVTSSITMADRAVEGEQAAASESQPEREATQGDPRPGPQSHFQTPIRPFGYQQHIGGGGIMIPGTEHLTVFNGLRSQVFHGAAGAPGIHPTSAYTTPGTFATPGYNSSQFHGSVYYPGQFTHQGGNTQGFPPQTPANMTYGNPIPPTYNQGSFRPRGFPALPAPSPLGNRAQQSQNWRTRSGESNANAPESTSMMMVPYQQPATAPGQNIIQGLNTFQPLTSYGNIPQVQTSTHPMHYMGSPNMFPPPNYNLRSIEWAHPMTGSSFNFYHFIPSSLSTSSVPTLQQVKDYHDFDGRFSDLAERAHKAAQRARRLRAEGTRVANNQPTVYTEEELDDDKWYARWSGGYVEVNDDLIARCVCPADLIAHPCPWDEFPGGCQMVRLCNVLEKNTTHLCEDREAGFPRLEAFEGEETEPSCPHLHWEVEGTCRFVASNKHCSIVTQKAYNCAVGHDFELGRQISRCRFEAHVRDALLAGATRRARKSCILYNRRHEHTFHLEMATGPGPLPAIHW